MVKSPSQSTHKLMQQSPSRPTIAGVGYKTRNPEQQARKKTVPSIPDYRRGRHEKPIGPCTYSPKDMFTSYHRGAARIPKPEQLPPEIGAPDGESNLRRKVLKIISPAEQEEDPTNFGISGSRNILDGHLRNSSSTHKLSKDIVIQDNKERMMVRKVSKVSILSTARKVENNKIMTE